MLNMKKFLIILYLIYGAKGQTDNLLVTFVYVNGSWVPVVTEEEPSYGISTRVIVGILLSLTFFLSFAGNVMLISTISSSLTLKRLSYNLIILQLGIIGLAEGFFNMIVSVAYLFTQPWRMGWFMCNINGFLMEVIPCVETLSLLLLTLDRTRALKLSGPFKKNMNSNLTRVKQMLVFVWAISIVTAVPVLAGIIQAWPFPTRYSCSLMHELAPYYGCVTLLICYIVPWFSFLICLIIIYSTAKKEKRKTNKENRGITQNKLSTTAANFLANNQFWNELRTVVLVSILLALYFVFWTPYIVFIKYDQVRQFWSPYNIELYKNKTENYYIAASTTTPNPTAPADTSTSSAGLTLQEPGYWAVPEVGSDRTYEALFIWLRYIHSFLCPLVILILNKDIRKKTSDLLIFWRSGTADSATPRPISAILHRQSVEQNRQKQMQKVKMTNYHVPVLFATNEGLYLRILDNAVEVAEKVGNRLEGEIQRNNWKVEPEFITEVCDLKLEVKGGLLIQPELRTMMAVREEMIEEEEDEGFQTGSSQDKEPLIDNKDKKKVHFRNTVVQIDNETSFTSSVPSTAERSESRKGGRGKKRKRKHHHQHRVEPDIEMDP